MSNIAQKLNALALQVKALVHQINAVFTIKDDLISTDVDAVLSANQGRILKETIDSLSANDVNAEPSGTVAAHNADVLAHANLLAAIANLENAVGSVSGLDTVAQVIVPAINEVRQQVYDLSGGLANIVIDDSALAGITEKTWSVDKIITELQAYKDSILGGAPSAALDTILELSTRLLDDGDAITAINSALSNRVRFDAAQSLTSPQMLQARQNIGAAAQSDVDALALVDNNFVRKDTAAQGLNATEKSNARTNLGLGSASTAADTDGVTEGATNKYFTEARVRGAILTGVSFASGVAVTAADSILIAIGKLQKQITDIGTGFTSRGAGNTITAGCEAVNCTSTTLQGTNNVAINCANLTVAVAQKEAQFFNIRTNTVLNNLLLPRGSVVNARANALSVESFFHITKPSNNAPVLVADSDGVKPAFTIGGNSQTYFNVAVHEITVLSGLGPAMAVRRVMAREGFGVTVTTLGTDVDSGLVFNITENAGRLDIAITGAGGYASSQLTLEVLVRSFYGS